MKINHVAIAVENVEDAVKAYQDALDIKSVEFETVESEGVKVAILHLENANIELMEPNDMFNSHKNHICLIDLTSPKEIKQNKKKSFLIGISHFT